MTFKKHRNLMLPQPRQIALPLLVIFLVAIGDNARAARPQTDFNRLIVRAHSTGGVNSTLPKAPTWPESYSVAYTFTLPFTAEIQPSPISYPVSFYRDASGKEVRARMETLHGTNVMVATKDVEYELVPRLDKQVCRVFRDMEEGESIAEANALPDISGWEFLGEVTFNGEESHLWAYIRHHEAKLVQYKFYLTPDAKPIRLHMVGNDIFSGAHFDEWIVDYTSFEPGRPDPALFNRPDGCDEVEKEIFGSISSGMHRMVASLPMVRYGGDTEYDAFLATHGQGRKHRSLEEYHRRRRIFSNNALKVAQHNAENKSFKMAMNKFGDWSREEFIAVMLPRKHRQRFAESVSTDTSSLGNRHMDKHELPYEPLTDPKRIPRSIDWRNTGANGIGVKDQANCGSCWAFGAAGAMESAWYMATGSSESFSEQQVMDCAWGYPETEESASACDGGDAWAGVGHIVEAGGISRTRDYQYLGQDDYCIERNATRVGKFKGYARIPRYDDEALMEAVYSRGPVAVSLDASQDSFTFYSHGVYYDTACMWKPADLDHSMMLVGYGTDPAGDYWLIKNSWSRHWGDQGYVKIARDGHGCGASTDAIYVVTDDDAATLRSRS